MRIVPECIEDKIQDARNVIACYQPRDYVKAALLFGSIAASVAFASQGHRLIVSLYNHEPAQIESTLPQPGSSSEYNYR